MRVKRIIVGICGSVAAFKAAEIVRLLKKKGAEVQVVLTPNGTKFITPLTLQALSATMVRSELFNPSEELGMDHISLAKWADLILVAPATANFIANLSHGNANDLLSTLCLATTAPIAIAPAMNSNMWHNPATVANVATLQQRGIKVLPTAEGEQACGDFGWGRMLEPQQIVDAIATSQPQLLQGKKITITAGPTQEALDPVRFLGNLSSGKMGYALAAMAAARGAEVTLISGPVALAAPVGVKLIKVASALEMLDAAINPANLSDIFIAAAAVADYRPLKFEPHKIKKSEEQINLTLIKNPDIIATIAAQGKAKFCVGFAAETENVIANAKKKLIQKQLDMIVANQVGIAGQGFAADNNQVAVISNDNEIVIELAAKEVVADKILQIINEKFKEKINEKCELENY